MRRNNTFFLRLACGLEFCLLRDFTRDFPPHFHDYFLLGCLLWGSREFTLDGENHFMGQGDIVLVEPHGAHGCAQAGSEKCVWFCAHIPIHLFEKHGGNAESLFLKNPDLWCKFSAMAVNLENRAEEGIIEEFIQILAHPALRGSGRECGAPQKKTDYPDIFRLCDFLAKNTERNISLDEMSEFARLDKFRLVRAFRILKHMTPARYHENLRLNSARIHLIAGEGICASALNSGFYDQSHFSRRFKLNMGFTPATCARGGERREKEDGD